MAKKKVVTQVKFQVPAQKATPAPPVGSSLGPHGVSAPQFVKEFNDATKGFDAGLLIPVIVTVYSDRSFSFELKSPPASVLIKKELGLSKASKNALKEKVGTITKSQLKKIVEIKKADLSANDIESAIKIIAGTARSMGIEVSD